MIIYRVQHKKDGRGPWRPGWSHVWVEDREDHDNLLPPSIEFNGISFKKGFYHGSGCSSISQLKRWFTESEYLTLKKYNFHSVIMKVDNVLGHSKTQVLFERKKALNKNVKAFTLY